MYHKWQEDRNIKYQKINTPFLKDWYNLSFYEIIQKYITKGFHDEVSNPL